MWSIFSTPAQLRSSKFKFDSFTPEFTSNRHPADPNQVFITAQFGLIGNLRICEAAVVRLPPAHGGLLTPTPYSVTISPATAGTVMEAITIYI
jgi:hypothetical protein